MAVIKLFEQLTEHKSAVAATAIFTYLVAQTVYNVFFHPLARYPGPFLCKISTWPSFYWASKGDRHLWLQRNFQKYGMSDTI
jgi:hypothetical protein